jgi:septum site-determining protein MinC
LKGGTIKNLSGNDMTTVRSNASDYGDLFSPDDKEPAIDLKGSAFTLPVLQLRTANLAAIETELKERLEKGPNFFKNAPVVIDLLKLRDSGASIDFPKLILMLRNFRLVPVGVQYGSAEQHEAAIWAGLAELKGLPPVTSRRRTTRKAEQDSEADSTPQRTSRNAANEYKQTKVIPFPVRSGQQIAARGGDLILLAAVNNGAELIADGNIHVYAPLRGRALAGVSGDTNARIFCQCMEAELVAIAGNYRVFEERVPPELYRKPVQVYLEGEKLIIAPLV